MNNLIQRLTSGQQPKQQQQQNQHYSAQTSRQQPLQTTQYQQQQHMNQSLPPTDFSENGESQSLRLAEPENEKPVKSIVNVTKQIKKQVPQKKQSGKVKLKPLGIREPWTEKHKVLSLSTPQEIQDKRSRKRYKIHIVFLTDKGQKKACTIRFGSRPEEQKDFVDHHNVEKRNMTLLRLNHNCDSVLNPNYWRIWLLNTEETIQKAWNNYIQQPEHNFLQL